MPETLRYDKNAHSQLTYTQSSFLGILAKQSKEEDIILVVGSAIKLETGITTIKPRLILNALISFSRTSCPLIVKIHKFEHIHSGVCTLFFH